MQFVPPYLTMGHERQYQSQGATQGLTTLQSGQMSQGKGRGRGQDSQAGTSRTQGRVYAITPQIKIADQSIIPGMFPLLRLWARILFDSSESHSFIA